MIRVFRTSIFLISIYLTAIGSAASDTSLAMHGAPKYQGSFTHFSYADPAALQGGHLRLPAIGTFNSLNPFLVRGLPAKGLGFIYQSLLSRARDEPFSLYANLASNFEIASDRSWITYEIDKRAHFSDGTTLTVEDVLFSYETLRKSGRPNHRQYYSEVEKVEIPKANTIRFTFREDAGREMPLILSLMPIVSKKYFSKIPFQTTSLLPPVGSGPYRVTSLEAGRRIVYEKDPNFWGAPLPQYKGRYNFKKITFDYFRDQDIAFEALLAGDLDVFFENNPAKWAINNRILDRPIHRATIDLNLPAPMTALAFNTRKKIFKDPNVRKALSLVYDHKWVNKNLLHGLYTRTSSYFQDSQLASDGLPSGPELDLLKQFEDELPKSLFTEPFKLSETDGTGRNRRNLKAAKSLLEESGWIASGSGLNHQETGASFSFEILLRDQRHLKLLSSYKDSLRKLGIAAKLRLVDSANYQNRIGSYDFDMIVARWGQSLSPGNEQAFYWSSKAGNQPGSRNYPGINLKSVDFLVDRIARSETRNDLEASTRALDRVLLWKHFVIPLQHTNQQWLYHWPHIFLPKVTSLYGTGLDVWWDGTVDAPVKKTQ